MNNSHKISLIVPIYGVEKYIRKFAETALGQTYDDIEFIFVNDGTKDRSMEILEALIEERFSHLRPRIVIINKENGGLPMARKSGLEVATGEYILFADSDDWLELDAVEKVVAEAERTDADIVYFDLVKEYGHKTSYKRERDYMAETKMEWVEKQGWHSSALSLGEEAKAISTAPDFSRLSTLALRPLMIFSRMPGCWWWNSSR